jgi:hypothetical protein
MVHLFPLMVFSTAYPVALITSGISINDTTKVLIIAVMDTIKYINFKNPISYPFYFQFSTISWPVAPQPEHWTPPHKRTDAPHFLHQGVKLCGLFFLGCAGVSACFFFVNSASATDFPIPISDPLSVGCMLIQPLFPSGRR